MKSLKAREQEILLYMQSEIREKGYPPTVREICAALNIKSTSTAHKDIASLEAKGYLKKDPAKPRALMVTLPDDFPGGASAGNSPDPALPPSQADPSGADAPLPETVIEVPVIGRIAAGTPILAEEHIEDTLPVPARFASKGVNYLLTVRGDSMIEAGIFDGDYILVEQQNTARDGEIVVAMVDGFESEATVKTFYREKDHIRLQPANSAMSPIRVNDVRILGRVKGVFRYF